ncbi:hypothetical protein [Mucilaginibacter gotjawali]|uniref:Uncharacterized protein n=2 Tax=Mucilaginibacter gotjawali TaxID=1550579 RepID=A0A0X8X4P6_9SPHI|nr:hypothetical protein [Mucilaginibacter gotjawali]MBB3058285.1 hypothetical protein [Mucilaginibacter gotjawali]BAU55596.1 hypothetical protein MgSA37_03787 [Mucilaginibacter gotjawali]
MELKNETKGLLYLDISNLPVSTGFIENCHNMGFNTLKDITDKGWIALMQKKDFTYRWFGELMALLESNQLVYLLQAKPDTAH